MFQKTFNVYKCDVELMSENCWFSKSKLISFVFGSSLSFPGHWIDVQSIAVPSSSAATVMTSFITVHWWMPTVCLYQLKSMAHIRASSWYSTGYYHCVLSHRHDCSNVQNTFALKIPASFQLIWINFWVCDHWISGEGYLSFVRNCQSPLPVSQHHFVLPPVGHEVSCCL